MAFPNETNGKRKEQKQPLRRNGWSSGGRTYVGLDGEHYDVDEITGTATHRGKGGKDGWSEIVTLDRWE